MSLNPVYGEVYSIQHYVIKFVSDLQQVGGILYTTLCDQVCRGQIGGFLYATLCDQVCRGQVGGFFYTTLCDQVCRGQT